MNKLSNARQTGESFADYKARRNMLKTAKEFKQPNYVHVSTNTSYDNFTKMFNIANLGSYRNPEKKLFCTMK